MKQHAAPKFLLLTFSLILILWGGSSCRKQSSNNSHTNASLPEKIDFNFHVRPILSDRCYACHGPDENARKSNFRLDIEATAFAALDSLGEHFAIVPGNLKKSILADRISSTDPEVIMPPPESKLTLNNYEIEILKSWIAQGAEWKPHWAFQPPVKHSSPQVADEEWAQNSVDLFILSRLEQEGLHPSKEATKEKLIRRLSFDLRGLPPLLPEIEAFTKDDSPEAYENVVDQFLSEETYGERLAMEWLDLARYADSHGYQDDIERSMWPWRDWVIKAFNNNMPYDKFVSWQLAGDLFPDATYEQKLATGFNRNHKITQEVGVVDEEYRVTYVLDRTSTFSTAFLGLTIECAQCHDHKFDPISQKDFYSLFSFFNSVPEKGRVDYGVEVANPSLPLPQEKIDELKDYVRKLFTSQQTKLQQYASEQWSKGFDTNQMDAARVDVTNLPTGLVAWYPLDFIEEDQLQEIVHGKSANVINELIPIPGKFSGGLEFMGPNYANLMPIKTFDFTRPFSASIWIKSLDGGIRGPVLASFIKDKNTNFLLEVSNNKDLRVRWHNGKNKTNLRIFSKKTIPQNTWVNIVITHDGSLKSSGVNLYMDGELLEVYEIADDLAGKLAPSQNLYLGKNDGGSGLVAGQLDELMLFGRTLTGEEVKNLSVYNPLSALLANKEKSDSDMKRLFYHQLTHHNLQYQEISDRLVGYKIREGRTEDIVTKPTMIMADMDEPRPTFILDRGQYDAPGETRVHPGTPSAVMAFEESLPKNRLGLAQWLFDAKNPLTARVAVNRYWQMIFGRGIVATPGDFGSQGSLPTHPALLDWLAVEFRESGWDVKELLKTMVMSSTYRQTVVSDKHQQQRDPENIFLARGAQVRLTAEMIRDHALTIGGLMSKQVGGPSVKPYQPKGLWLEVASGNQSLRKYIQDHDDELYRRSLYTFWKRTLPPPSMTIFDAPSREQCTIKRGATSTPMQALVLLNDPQFIEASRVLAARMVTEGGETVEERIAFAFQLATSRLPDRSELRLLLDLFQEEKAEFEANPEDAKKLLSIGEYEIEVGISSVDLAAYSVLANTIMNMTETILKG